MSKRTKERCRRWCPAGFTTCRFHGSATATTIAKAGERVAEAEARKALAGMGELAPVEDPIHRLQLLAAEADALLAFARQKFVSTDDTSWLVLYGRALESVQKQLETLAKLLPPIQKAKAEADEARVRATFAKIDGVLGGVLGDEGAGLIERQQARIKHALAVALGGPVPLPPAPPGHGESGQLPGLQVALDLLTMLSRRGPSSWRAEARPDVERLQRAAQAFLSVHGEPADVVDPLPLPTPQRALEGVITDAEVVG